MRRKRAKPPIRTAASQCAAVDAAMERGSFRVAAELAHGLFGREPTDGHRRLLVESTLAQVERLRVAGRSAEASSFLESVTVHAPATDLLPRWVEELVYAGLRERAEVAVATSASDIRARAQAALADAVVLQGERVPAGESAFLGDQTAMVLDGLACVAAEQDAEARRLVGTLSSDSPLHEWGVFIDGLIDYYSGQIRPQTWATLSDERAPRRIADALQASADPAFVASGARRERGAGNG